MVPIPAIACQSRGFDAENGAYFARTDFTHQPLESGPLDQTRSGASEVVIYKDDVLEPKFTCTFDQSVLAPLTLLIMENLAR